MNYKIKITISIATVLIIASIIWFNIDIGVNTSIFIKRDIQTAFNKRIIGDIEGFRKFLVDTSTNLDSLNNENKTREIPTSLYYHALYEERVGGKIYDYEITNIEHDLGSKKAFVLVKLKRNKFFNWNTEFRIGYEVVYDNHRWKLLNNQEEFSRRIIN